MGHYKVFFKPAVNKIGNTKIGVNFMAGINGLGSTNAYCFTLRASGNQKRIEDRLNSNQNDKLGGVKANPTRTPLDIESWEYIILKDKEPLENLVIHEKKNRTNQRQQQNRNIDKRHRGR